MILTGILTGLVCVGLNKGVSTLIKFRNSTMAHLVEQHESVAPAFLMNLAYGVSLTAIAACMVRRPAAVLPLHVLSITVCPVHTPSRPAHN